MKKPSAFIRRLRVYRAIFGAVGSEMTYAGILEKKGESVKGFEAFRSMWWLFFLVALLIPEPFLDPTVYFVSILGLAVAWLFGAIQYQGAIVSDADLLSIRGRIEVFADELNNRLKKEGFEVPQVTPAMQEKFRADVTPETVRATGRSVLYYGLLLLSQRAILAAIVSLIGLLWGPALSRFHIFYWSPVSILYALTFPYAVLLLAMILAIVVIHYYVARVGVDPPQTPDPSKSESPPGPLAT
mgnify:CR=1 FL=1